MLHGMVAASLQDIIKAYQVAFDIAIGVGDAVADSGLGSEVDYNLRMIGIKQQIYHYFVGYIAPDKTETGIFLFGWFL